MHYNHTSKRDSGTVGSNHKELVEIWDLPPTMVVRSQRDTATLLLTGHGTGQRTRRTLGDRPVPVCSRTKCVRAEVATISLWTQTWHGTFQGLAPTEFPRRGSSCCLSSGVSGGFHGKQCDQPGGICPVVLKTKVKSVSPGKSATVKSAPG